MSSLALVLITSTGTGNLTLGDPLDGFVSLTDAGVANGEQITYKIDDANSREMGLGTYTSATNTLTRDVILSSTNANNPINLSGKAILSLAVNNDFIKEPHIADNSIVTRHVANNNIVERHIANNNVIERHIANNNVVERHIANNNVTNSKLNDMPAWSFKARNNLASGDPQDVAFADLTEQTDTSNTYVIGFSNSALRKFAFAGYRLGSRQIFTASGTWTKPAGVRAILVEVVGGGGGGGGCDAGSTGNSSVGAGGGAGKYAQKFMTSGFGSTETVTVGSGGTSSSSSNGNAGNSSSFGSHVSAGGGSGGTYLPASGVVATTRGGAGGSSGTGGDININGSPGGNSIQVAGQHTTGGNGGAGPWGGGGLGGFASGGSATGTAGQANSGSGGGGAASAGAGSARTGGGGGSGIVIVWEYY